MSAVTQNYSLEFTNEISMIIRRRYNCELIVADFNISKRKGDYEAQISWCCTINLLPLKQNWSFVKDSQLIQDTYAKLGSRGKIFVAMFMDNSRIFIF